MTKRKTAITVDPDKAEAATRLLGTTNFSEIVDRALTVLIREEQGRRDLEAYERQPLTAEERALCALGSAPALDDDVDWEALHPEPR
jgi:Arc/MetJ family transcription regulator